MEQMKGMISLQMMNSLPKNYFFANMYSHIVSTYMEHNIRVFSI